MTSPQANQGLTKHSINSASWTILGFGISQIIRLASSLLLTRFLAPEHFGVISIVTVFMIGLAMFSDLGIGPSIIHSERGKDRNFLNTAWTLQVIRGGIIWLFCLALAWPLALFYAEPQLMWLIPVSGLTAIISGFSSTGIYTLNRDLNIKRVVINEVSAQITSLILMVMLAYIYPSVWVLVAGSLWASLFGLIMSHRLDRSVVNQFHWDKEAAASLIHFGKWIFFSTICAFFVNSGGTLILGKFMSMSMLGLFSIGLTLAKTVELVFNQINSRVVMPLYAKIKHLSDAEIKPRIAKVRLALMAVFLPPLWLMVLFADEITSLLFDSRYQGSAWIMQVFALSYIPVIVSGLGNFYLAMGNSLLGLKIGFIKMLVYFSAIYIGWLLSGSSGMIYGIALSNIMHYVGDAWAQRVYKIWLPKLDVLGLGGSLAVITIISYVK